MQLCPEAPGHILASWRGRRGYRGTDTRPTFGQPVAIIKTGFAPVHSRLPRCVIGAMNFLEVHILPSGSQEIRFMEGSKSGCAQGQKKTIYGAQGSESGMLSDMRNA